MSEILHGDALTVLRERFADESVQCVVTSPPYWGLRDYKVAGQLGLEATPEEYTTKMVEVFRDVRRVLKNDGTLWLNLGDTYSTGSGGTDTKSDKQKSNNGTQFEPRPAYNGLPPKNLVGIPWRVAFALQADGWYLRSDIIWSKPNPMPESVTDRPTKSHEYLFLLSKSERYYYDAEAIMEPATGWHDSEFHTGKTGEHQLGRSQKVRKPAGWDTGDGAHGTIHRNGRAQDVEYTDTTSSTRNKRTVWTIATQPYAEAHFATFPPKLIEPCVLAGCPVGGLVLDPFCGSGTTLMVAQQLGRRGIGIELNADYIALAQKRLQQQGLPL